MGYSRRRVMNWDRKRVKFLLDTTFAIKLSCLQVYIVGGWMVK